MTVRIEPPPYLQAWRTPMLSVVQAMSIPSSFFLFDDATDWKEISEHAETLKERAKDFIQQLEETDKGQGLAQYIILKEDRRYWARDKMTGTIWPARVIPSEVVNPGLPIRRAGLCPSMIWTRRRDRKQQGFKGPENEREIKLQRSECKCKEFSHGNGHFNPTPVHTALFLCRSYLRSNACSKKGCPYVHRPLRGPPRPARQRRHTSPHARPHA